MTDLATFITSAQAADGDGLNATRLQNAFNAAAIDGYLTFPPYTIHYTPTAAPVLKGHVHTVGYGETLSTLWNHNPVVPHFQIGDGSTIDEDGSMEKIGLWRPAWPLAGTSAAACPSIDVYGQVARFRLDRMHLRNHGRGVRFRNGPSGTPFGWLISDIYSAGPQSLLYVQNAFGMAAKSCIHNAAQGSGTNGFYDQSALVEIVGEVDGFELSDRCIANMSDKGLLNAHASANVAGVKIRDSWYDKVKTAGVFIAPQNGSVFNQFEIDIWAWGGSTPGMTGSAVSLETRTQDDIRYGKIKIQGTAVAGNLVFMADRSPSGLAGRIDGVTVYGCRSTERAGLASAAMIEFAGTRGLNCKLIDTECIVGSQGHSAVYANQGGMANLYIGADVRAL